jgi:hypothetical protein
VRVKFQAKADQTIGASLATYTGTLVTPGESGARLTLLTPVLPAGTTALHVIFRFYGTATVSAGWVGVGPRPGRLGHGHRLAR